MKCIAAAFVLTLTVFNLPVAAAEPTGTGAVATFAEATATALADAGVATTAAVAEARPAEWLAARRRPSALPTLYVSFAALQMFDLYSTRRAIAGGAQEANPMMNTVVGNRAMFWTVKAAATVAPMLAAERLWKSNKIAAIAVMAVSNGVMVAVAAHNAKVLRSQR